MGTMQAVWERRELVSDPLSVYIYIPLNILCSSPAWYLNQGRPWLQACCAQHPFPAFALQPPRSLARSSRKQHTHNTHLTSVWNNMAKIILYTADSTSRARRRRIFPLASFAYHTKWRALVLIKFYTARRFNLHGSLWTADLLMSILGHFAVNLRSHSNFDRLPKHLLRLWFVVAVNNG